MHRSRVMMAAATAAVFVLASLAAPAAAGAAPAGGIVTQLKHLPGVTYLGKNAFPPAGYQVYELEIRQPINHHDPNGPTFEQHLELYQRNVKAPMVMYLSGYFNYTFLTPQDVYLSPATMITGGNQISVENRFFGDSIPHPTLWRYLTIWQEAADEHHVLQEFKKLYHSRWLVAGVSKGAEAAIDHDFYYPDDFAGTFAWSPPIIDDTNSHRFDNFLASVGTASCRAALQKTEVRALRHRKLFETMNAAEAKAAHGTFTFWKHGLDENFELSVLVTPFAFWQAGVSCKTIPGGKASLKTLYNWIDGVSGWLAADDQEEEPFVAYNYQAQSQLGYPILHVQSEFGSLLHYSLAAQAPQQDNPPNIPIRPLNTHLMPVISKWVLHHASHLVLLYGQDDPWSSWRVLLGSGSRDSASFTIAGGTHNTPYTALTAAQQKKMINMLRSFAGLTATGRSAEPAGAEPAFVSRLAGLG